MSLKPQVTTGLERLLADGAPSGFPGRGARIGLVAHLASVDATARHAVERIAEAGNYRLERLFAPEHGLWGHEQDMERVDDAVDPSSGLPVISLYGEDKQSLRARHRDLEGLDGVLVDLQDVGSRYYTYVYTLSLMMEVAAELDLPVLVLDRPNPIGGRLLEGPVLDPGLASFVGRYALPVRHAMTIAELAALFNEAFEIGCRLFHVPMSGWERDMSFEGTGLPWVPPSPNMPTPTTARVYPGGCLLEGTNLSEGRGTTLPFELAGAPWIDAGALVESLRAERFDGVLFRQASFRPLARKYSEQNCSGVQVIVANDATFRPFAAYLALIREAHRLAPDDFGWRTEPYEFEESRLAIDLLLGRHELRPMVEAHAAVAEMEASWAADLRRFEELRSRFLLY